MNELIAKIRARFAALGQSFKTFYSANKGMVLSGVTVVSILLIVWARLGFTFEIGRFFAAQLPAPGVLSVQCTSTQAILSWNIPAGSTTNAIQKNINGQGWQFINNDPAPYSQTTLTDTFTPTTVYRHKSDPNVVSNLVQCPPAGTPTPSATTPACSATNPTALSSSQITAQSAVLSWTPGTGGAFQQLRVGSNQAEVMSGCQANPTTCAVAEHNLPSAQTSYQIPSGRLTANTTYYWRVVNFSTAACYRDASASFTTSAASSPSATPLVTINAIDDPLTTVLGTVRGTASDDVGVASVKVVLRRGPPGPLNSAANPDWNGTDFIDNGGTRFELTATGTTNWSYSQTPPADKMTDGAVYTLYAFSLDTHNQSSGTGATYRSFTYKAPTPTPVQTTRPPAPSGCYYQEVQCVTTPCDPVLVCPTLTPTATPAALLSMNVLAANLSTAPATYSPAVTATNNQNVAVRVVLANGANTDSVSFAGAASALNVSLKATVPQGLVYVPGSTTLNGTPLSADTITTGGVTLGALPSGESMTIDFRIRVNGAVFPVGQTQAGVTVQAQAESGVSASGAVTVIVQKAAAGQPGTVQTGPGDAVFAALLISAILTLLYVSYTHTSVFRRREVETITKSRDPLDFRS